MMQQMLVGLGGADAFTVDNVFNTSLYTGSSSTQTITNGIDLAGEGGMVWIKNRDNVRVHSLYDSERSLSKRLRLPNVNAEQTLGGSGTLTFNSNGLSIPSGDGDLNQNGFGKQVAWTFRKAPGFFDCFEYTGDPTSSQQLNHNLGCDPGMVIIKRTDTSSDWGVYMRNGNSSTELGTGFLNTDGGFTTSGIAFTANSTFIRVYSSAWSTFDANDNGGKYMAYIFAQGGADSAAAKFGANEDEKIIRTGTITSNGSSHGSVDIGFEPQWIMIKKTTTGDDWFIFDTMRGFGGNGTNNKRLRANGTSDEANYPYFYLSGNGFGWDGPSLGSHTYFYMAIRKGQ